jgi:hypothetical protein
MIGMFQTLRDTWQWLISPWALPPIGALAAVLAALTVEPASWIRGPVRAIGRAVIVAIAWTLAVWILQKATGLGGGNGGGGGAGSFGTEVIEAPMRASTEVAMTPSLPGGTSPDRLTIRFLPSNGDPSRAKAFSCEVVIPGRAAQEQAKIVTVRETSMDGFRDRLSSTLRDHATTNDSPPWASAAISQHPYPGEPALLTVTGCIKATFPAVTIQRVVREGEDHQ